MKNAKLLLKLKHQIFKINLKFFKMLIVQLQELLKFNLKDFKIKKNKETCLIIIKNTYQSILHIMQSSSNFTEIPITKMECIKMLSNKKSICHSRRIQLDLWYHHLMLIKEQKEVVKSIQIFQKLLLVTKIFCHIR